MNLAHLHLVLNHIPVIGIPMALVFLIYGYRTKNHSSQRFALLVLIGLALMVLPVYLTGEPAEEVVEHLPGVAESLIESHEEAAKFSLVLTLITGATAFLALWFQEDSRKSRLLILSVVGIGSLAMLSLVNTANLGGKVRHTEFADGAQIAKSLGDSQKLEREKDDD